MPDEVPSAGSAGPVVRYRLRWDCCDLAPPDYATDGAAGADLRAALSGPLELLPGERALVPTGLTLEIPAGFQGEVRARSGLALRKGLCLANGVGTIDSDYRGEVGVILTNLGREPVTIERGERIAQLIVSPVARARFVASPLLADSFRGEGGFGSTGSQ
jgi:dUTP pyrophosphatase